MDFAVSADHRVKIKENEKRDKFLDLAQKTKKAVEVGRNCDANRNWHTRNGPQKLEKGTESIKNQRTSRNHPNYSTVKERLRVTWCHSDYSE